MVAGKLRDLGFIVTIIENSDTQRLRTAVREFGRSLPEDRVALVYFTGHAAQFDSQNYLLPVDAKAEDTGSIRSGIAVNDVVAAIRQPQGQRAINIIVVDAAHAQTLAGQYRGMAKGLAPMVAPLDFLIAFASSPGSVAQQPQESKLSPYTRAFLAAVDGPDKKVETVFKRIRVAVGRNTDRSQVPWHTSSLLSDFYFRPSSETRKEHNAASLTTREPPTSRGIRVAGSENERETSQHKLTSNLPARAIRVAESGANKFELALWEVIKESENPADFEAYLDVFPEGYFATQAKQNLARLKDERAAKATKKTPAPSTEIVKIDEIGQQYELVKTANLRDGPTTKAKIVGQVEKGAQILVLGRVVGKSWYRVSTDAGLTAYVAARLLTKVDTKSVSEAPTATTEIQPEQDRETQTASVGRTPDEMKMEVKPPVSPLDVTRDCKDCPELVVIGPGVFVMGSDTGDPNERPAHRVHIRQAFAMGRYEVTISQWRACVIAGACRDVPKLKTAHPDSPIHKLSWTDAEAYVGWLTRTTGKSYRLPTEAEWEYAARAGTNSRYWWGDRMVAGVADCKGCDKEWNYASPRPVASSKANAFGLHGMSGGVWEWTVDCWYRDYAKASRDGSAFTDPVCGQRVLRGGSWRNNADYARSASRFKYDSDVRYSTNGMRVVRELR
jgi:formylglycine-generating enzyme required for sulfatase activity